MISRRMQAFGAAVKRVQDALLEYRAVVKSNPAAAAARQKAIEAFQNTSRGLTLTRSNRALEIARTSRRIAKLRVFDEVQASRLVRFGKYGRYLGNGLVVIDFGSRVNKIHDSYEAGEDWYREMFIESSSFAVSAIGGLGVVYAGSAIAKASLAVFVAATPSGWVLIVVGIGVAAAAAGTSILLDKNIKENAGSWYDLIRSQARNNYTRLRRIWVRPRRKDKQGGVIISCLRPYGMDEFKMSLFSLLLVIGLCIAIIAWILGIMMKNQIRTSNLSLIEMRQLLFLEASAGKMSSLLQL